MAATVVYFHVSLQCLLVAVRRVHKIVCSDSVNGNTIEMLL